MLQRPWLLAIAGIGLLARGVSAQTGTGGTIMDGDVIFTQGESPSGTGGPTGAGPLGNMTTTTGTNVPDQVFQNWWWYRVDGVDAREFALANASGASWSGNTGTVNFTLPSFTAVLTYVVTDTGTNAGQVVTSLQVTNTTGGPIALHLFNYQDFDLAGTPGLDAAVLGGPNDIRVTDTTAGTAGRYVGTGANAYQVTVYQTLRTLLTNTTINDLAGTGLPFAAADFTGGYEWNLSLGAGGSVTVSASFAVAPPPPVGRCCIGSMCVVRNEEDCRNQGGVWGGEGTTCPVGDYMAAQCNNPFEDISATGTLGPVGDDASVNAPLGFTFSYFGAENMTINLYTNGYLNFGAIVNVFTNPVSLPSTATPNNTIAPYWDDWYPTTPANGQVRYQTLGIAPNRRFVAQWNNVGHYNGGMSPVTFSTFEALLFEGSNNIQFRYGTLAPTDTPTIGIENGDGTIGVNVPVGTQGTCTAINFQPGANPCAPVCPCDWNHSGQVNSQDYFDFLTAFFEGNADYNHDMMTNSQDYFDFLTCFFQLPSGCM